MPSPLAAWSLTVSIARFTAPKTYLLSSSPSSDTSTLCDTKN